MTRVALVTGGSRGLGAAIGRKLGHAGCPVAVVSRDLARAREVANAIVSEGGTAQAIRCDVTARREVDACVDAVVDAYGSVDILVSNAGITRDNLIHKMTDDDWDSVIATNLTGPFLIARAVQRQMVARRYGKIIFIGSTASAGNRGQTNYAAAKAGLQGMARTLAIELGPFGINVNVVAPGHIDTDMTRGVATRLGIDYRDVAASRIAENAIKRIGSPEDIAATVGFLVSDEASYITGQVVTVSGKASMC